MADVLKTVIVNQNGDEITQEPVEQDFSDTNAEVVKLFNQKPDLQSVTLDFGPGFNGDVRQKLYKRL